MHGLIPRLKGEPVAGFPQASVPRKAGTHSLPIYEKWTLYS